MSLNDYAKGAIGSVIGFALGQTVNLAKLWNDRRRRPRLHIEFDDDNARTLTHHTDTEHGWVEEITYGFKVRNSGLSMAEDVMVFLIDYRIDQGGSLAGGGRASRRLRWNDALDGEEFKPKVILPGAAAQVDLAAWRGDSDVFHFATIGQSPYYEEGMSGVRLIEVTLGTVARSTTVHTVTKRIQVGPRPRRDVTLDASVNDVSEG